MGGVSYLSSISFTLYLIHPITLKICNSIIYKVLPKGGFFIIVWFILLFASAVAAAMIFYNYIVLPLERRIFRSLL